MSVSRKENEKMNYTTHKPRGLQRWLRALNRADGGIAVVMVTLVGVAVAGIVAVLAMNTVRNYRESRQERQYGEVLVLAEAGLDQAVFELNLDSDFTTTGPAPAFADEDTEAAWVIAEAAALTPLPGQAGEYVIVKPDGSDVAYSVAYSTTQADSSAQIRVLKAALEVTPRPPSTPWIPISGFASNGQLSVGNSAAAGIHGSIGGAHANGVLSQGGSATISGCSSAEGSNEFAGDNPSECGPATGITKAIAPVEPLAFHEYAMFDLCDDGGSATVKMGPAYAGTVAGSPAAARSPCTGTALGSPASFGWSNSGASWSYQGGAGVFYVNGADEVTLSSNSGTGANGATIIVGAFNEGSTTCNVATGVGNVVGGDLSISGNRQFLPHESMGDLALVIGRDVTIRGTSDIHGVILAREQVSIGGTPGANNAVVSSSPCHTPGSPESANEIFGTASVTYNGGLNAIGYGLGTGGAIVSIDRFSELDQ